MSSVAQPPAGAAARLKGALHQNGNGSLSNGAVLTNGNGLANGNGSHDFSGPDTEWEQHFAPPQLTLSDPVRAQKISSRLSGLCLSGGVLLHTLRVFTRELAAGLGEQPSSLQMANTYIPELPDGTESGRFLALDLGGTNFRVLLLVLDNGVLLEERVQHYHISDALRVGPGVELFNFLADCVAEFVRAQGLQREPLSLGFTFSFPMHQHSISSGELVTWTKSFKCGGMQGVDVAALLQQCLTARSLDISVRVLLNDTTGTLVTGAHADPNVCVGVILGTGSNGCYIEHASRVQHWESAHERVTDVAVDVEWGAFGDNGCLGFLRTHFDDDVDAHAVLPGSFTFEKYIGGKYLGCVARAALTSLVEQGLFPVPLRRHHLTTTHLSLFEEERLRGSVSETIATLRAVSGRDDVTITADDALVAQHVATLVARRAAQLASVCIAALLRRMERPRAGVAVDGSVYKKHPTIRHLMQQYIALLAPGHDFFLMDADDGSGKGSALTAAIAARIQRRDAKGTSSAL